MGPLGGFLDLRSAIGVAVGGGWVFRVFIGSWVDYRDVYYESSFWLGPCEVGAPGGGVPDDDDDDDDGPGWVWRMSAARAWTTRW